MKTWFRKFWYQHGERLIYLSAACSLAAGMLIVGRVYEIAEFVDTSKIIFAGAAMLLFNKARGSSIEQPTKENSNA